ncbi:molybdate ABC transporter permease subunit [Pseudothauera nasutitermitis]|uniref:Molybdenum transport system permease n=1 Tax=Pseudothauera nasutitermitis TaxID=2565930 RepID=A0A4S4AZA0_9RHOO|nr:molybdate ABC transporter permease subunit [Pseudothauera nasutitermitis]THF64701.1 molybdate ABC transporter permease subunit [Pseudothauera nasutitermitis]
MLDTLNAMPAVLAEADVRHALALTARVAAATLVLHLLAALALGAALARPAWPGRGVLDALVTLPLVFPPIATGFALLLLFGRRGPLGGWLEGFGVEIIFSFWGVLIASFIAGLPLVVKPVQAALEAASARLSEAARTLGKNELQIFFRVLLPNVRGALAAGLVLGLGRSLGEVGITLMLGGNVMGRTNTVSLEIYNAVSGGDFQRAAVLSLLLGAFTLLLFWGLRRLGAV